MRLPFAILALTLAGCSSSSGPSKQGLRPQSTPRPQAAELNLVGAPSGAPGGASGSSHASGTGGPGGPGADPGTAPGSTGPGGTEPGRPAGNPERRPPIEPGLSRMPGYQPSLLVTNPGSGTLARGYILYRENCSMCHGTDLKGEPSVPTVPKRDLTQFKAYKFGSTDQAIYRTIVYGIPKTAMGNFQNSLQPQQVWDLINFMKSKRLD